MVHDLVNLGDDKAPLSSNPMEDLSFLENLDQKQLEVFQEATGLEDNKFEAIKEEESENEEDIEGDRTIDAIERDIDAAYMSSSLKFDELGMYMYIHVSLYVTIVIMLLTRILPCTLYTNACVFLCVTPEHKLIILMCITSRI